MLTKPLESISPAPQGIQSKIAIKFAEIMELLGLDLTDDSLIDTPNRVAKMYTEELFKGLLETNFPRITSVYNKMEYNEMLVMKDIEVLSICEHHFVPIVGVAHVAYIPKKKIMGISKFNRVVDYYSRRPQIQERLTNQIHSKLKEILETDDVAVIIDAEHFCIRLRGVKQNGCTTKTSAISGVFKKPSARSELYSLINH